MGAPLRHPPREITEDAVRLIRTSHEDYKSSQSKSRSGGRVLVSTTAFGSHDTASALREACYFRTICIVEAFVDALLGIHFNEVAPEQGSLLRLLADEAEVKASTTWAARKEAFKKYHSMEIAQCPGWSELEAGIEVRNSIAHGLGRLTKMQRRKNNMHAKLGSIEVHIMDGRIALTDDSLTRASSYSIRFIKALDMASRDRSAIISQAT